MADTFQEIKAALIKEFKGKFPAYAVSCEDLTKTDEPGRGNDLEDWIFLDLTATAPPPPFIRIGGCWSTQPSTPPPRKTPTIWP